PNTRLAGTQLPVKLRVGYLGSVHGPPDGQQSAAVSQRFAAPEKPCSHVGLWVRQSMKTSDDERPGGTPATSSQPIFTVVVIGGGGWVQLQPLSCVQVYSTRSPGMTSIGAE